MSGEQRRPEAPHGAPWSLDLLADLHAGALDEDTAEQVRRGTEADPEAADILAALDATTADLADPAPLPMPDDVATRIEQALADEVRSWSHDQHDQHDQRAAAGPAPERNGTGSAASATGVEKSGNVVDLARRRRRRYGWGTGILVAAAISGIAVLAPSLFRDDSPQQAQLPSGSADTTPTPPSGPPPLALHGDPEGAVSLNGAQFSAAMGEQQYHSNLSNPAAVLACLQANGIDSGRPLGARAVTVDGRPAQLFVLPGGELGQFRILTVGTSCGMDNPDTISDGVFGGM